MTYSVIVIIVMMQLLIYSIVTVLLLTSGWVILSWCISSQYRVQPTLITFKLNVYSENYCRYAYLT